jgi:hypothetical protein
VKKANARPGSPWPPQVRARRQRSPVNPPPGRPRILGPSRLRHDVAVCVYTLLFTGRNHGGQKGAPRMASTPETRRGFLAGPSPASLSSPGLRGPGPSHRRRGLLGAGFTFFTFFTCAPGPHRASDFTSSPSPASLSSPADAGVNGVKRVKGRLESPGL